MSETLFTFETTNAGGVVDTDKAVISGVSMITGDVTAKGHDLEVDDTTLKQILLCAKAKGKVPVKTNHGSGVDSVNGYLENFEIDGGKLRGNWHLLKSYPQTAQLLEMASRMPESVGLSVAFHGTPETADGRKVFSEKDPKSELVVDYTLGAKGEKVPLKAGEKKFARCSELVSTDLVASPAANPDGMFSSRSVDKGNEGMAKPSNSTPAAQAEPAAEPTLADLMKAIQGLGSRIEAIEAGGGQGDDDGNVELTDEEIEKGLAEGWLKEGENGELTMVGEPADDDGEGEEQHEAAPAGQAEVSEEAAAEALGRGDLPTYFNIKNLLLERRMTAFENAQKAKELSAARAAEQTALTTFETKLTHLTDEFAATKEELAAKNQLIVELRQKQPRVRTSGDSTMFGNPDAGADTYEAQVSKVHAEMLRTHPQMKEFARKAAAQEAVKASHPQLFQVYLQKKGVLPTNL